MSDSIGTRYHKLQKERVKKTRELMEEYDKNVFYPALKALVEECANTPEGHSKTKYHDNGLGWHWWYCGRCGTAHSKEKHTAYEDDIDD